MTKTITTTLSQDQEETGVVTLKKGIAKGIKFIARGKGDVTILEEIKSGAKIIKEGDGKININGKIEKDVEVTGTVVLKQEMASGVILVIKGDGDVTLNNDLLPGAKIIKEGNGNIIIRGNVERDAEVILKGEGNITINGDVTKGTISLKKGTIDIKGEVKAESTILGTEEVNIVLSKNLSKSKITNKDGDIKVKGSVKQLSYIDADNSNINIGGDINTSRVDGKNLNVLGSVIDAQLIKVNTNAVINKDVIQSKIVALTGNIVVKKSIKESSEINIDQGNMTVDGYVEHSKIEVRKGDINLKKDVMGYSTLKITEEGNTKIDGYIIKGSKVSTKKGNVTVAKNVEEGAKISNADGNITVEGQKFGEIKLLKGSEEIKGNYFRTGGRYVSFKTNYNMALAICMLTYSVANYFGLNKTPLGVAITLGSSLLATTIFASTNNQFLSDKTINSINHLATATNVITLGVLSSDYLKAAAEYIATSSPVTSITANIPKGIL